MAGSSNQVFGVQQAPCPIFSGENFDFWCVKMKTLLESNDLWEYVEEGFDDPEDASGLMEAEKQQLKLNKRKNARALSLIQQGVADMTQSFQGL